MGVRRRELAFTSCRRVVVSSCLAAGRPQRAAGAVTSEGCPQRLSGRGIIDRSHEIPSHAGDGDPGRAGGRHRALDLSLAVRTAEPLLAEDGHPRLRRHGPRPGPAVDAERAAAQHSSGWSIRAVSTRSAPRTRRSRRRRGPRSPPASTPASTTSTTSWCATPRPTCPISAWSRREPARFLLQLLPDREAEASTRSAAAPRSGSPRASAGVRIEHPHGAGDVPAGGRPERRAALRPAAARHPRDDGHVLLLRDRPEPLRRRQHRVRRHPQAAACSRTTSPAPS